MDLPPAIAKSHRTSGATWVSSRHSISGSELSTTLSIVPKVCGSPERLDPAIRASVATLVIRGSGALGTALAERSFLWLVMRGTPPVRDIRDTAHCHSAGSALRITAPLPALIGVALVQDTPINESDCRDRRASPVVRDAPHHRGRRAVLRQRRWSGQPRRAMRLRSRPECPSRSAHDHCPR